MLGPRGKGKGPAKASVLWLWPLHDHDWGSGTGTLHVPWKGALGIPDSPERASSACPPFSSCMGIRVSDMGSMIWIPLHTQGQVIAKQRSIASS